MKLPTLTMLAACLAAPSRAPAQAPQPLWELGAIGGAVATPSYPGADSRASRALALPLLVYRGPVLRSDQSGIGARLFRSDAAELDLGFAASLQARSDEVEARAGMPDLGTLVEFGPRLKLRLAAPTPDSVLRLELPLRAVAEVRGGVRHQGWTLEPRLAYALRDAAGNWEFDANLGAVLGDAGINRYFYEVQPAQATAQRPAYAARSGLVLLRAGASAWRKLHPDVRVLGFVRLDGYADAANRDSPLMRRDSGWSAGFGLAWTLKRSSRPARE